MGARTDLLTVAEGIATEARRCVSDEGHMGLSAAEVAANLAHGANAALAAARLAEDMGPGEIEEALASIRDVLEEAGVLAEAEEQSPVVFLKLTFRALVAWREEVLTAQGFVVAYEQLQALAVSLERDFIVGDTETSRRIAGRIRTALDEADEIINHAKGAPDAGSEAQ